MRGRVMNIGVISDTHGVPDPRVLELFVGVDHIFHAGDIGAASVLRALERIAPVTAVSGNSDCGLGRAETGVVTLGSFTFVLRHIFDPRSPGAAVRELLGRFKPNALVFGHTHAACSERWGDLLLFNPGVAGDVRGARRRSVGRLRLDDGRTEGAHLDM